MQKAMIAVDIGASSGRLILGSIEEGTMKLEEIHRFKNSMSMVNGHYHWDVDHLLEEIISGMKKVATSGMDVASIGVDTWAVDYVLLDKQGEKVSDVYAYRDHRTDETMEKVFGLVSREDIYKKTGIQFLQFNTIYQLYEHVKNNEEDIEQATFFLMIPDYINYKLSGVKAVEYTNASSTQLLSVEARDWDQSLLEAIGIPSNIMPTPVEAGTILGELTDDVSQTTGIKNLKVIAPATHDTGSAVVAVPAVTDEFAYISSGTWSLMGIESQTPNATKKAMDYNFTNEGGAYGTYRFLKNIMGLWLIQEVSRNYKDQYSFAEFVTMAEAAPPFRSLINPNDQRFLNPPNMIEAIQSFCKETNQPVPSDAGEIARCIFESLAYQYRQVLDQLKDVTGKSYTKIHIIGGGCQNEMLNQLCANFTGCDVLAGPIEATAIGNIAVQMIELEMVKDLTEARKLIRDSFDIKVFRASSTEEIESNYQRFIALSL